MILPINPVLIEYSSNFISNQNLKFHKYEWFKFKISTIIIFMNMY